ncbi:ATP-binding protein [Streptomyces sp. NPDC004682]
MIGDRFRKRSLGELVPRPYTVDPGADSAIEPLERPTHAASAVADSDPSAVKGSGSARGPIELRLNRSARSTRRARVFVLESLPAGRLEERADDISVCVSELVTNAVRHGSPAGHLVLVRVIVHETLLRVEVHDASGTKPRMETPADDDVCGRGLVMVDALADDWGTTSRDGIGKIVWIEFKISEAAPVDEGLPR